MLPRVLCRAGAGAAVLLLGAAAAVVALDDPPAARTPPTVIGRWDVTVRGPDGEYPSWFEVQQSGYKTLVGSFVGRFGSARPVSRVEYDAGRVRFTLPPQWERRTDDQVFEALGRAAVSHQVVLTKCDEVKPAELAGRIAEVEAALSKRPAAYPAVLATSAHDGAGIAELRAAIARLLQEQTR